MKKLLTLFVLLLCVLRMDAASLKLDGDLTWEITEPRCLITLDGGIQNLGPSDSSSGTLKLVLWATSAPFPSRGHVVAEHTLGEIGGGYQFSDFSVKTRSDVPNVTGIYHFTLAVLEYTTAGWRTQLVVRTGTRSLTKGDFTDQKKWKLSNKNLIKPPAALGYNKTLSLRQMATVELNEYPVTSQVATSINVRKLNKVRVTNAAGTSSALFTYQTGKTTLKGLKVPVGTLSLDYAAATGSKTKSTAKFTLYFRSANSGFYRTVETLGSSQEIHWGEFQMK
jgi:hypothetical protein